MLSIYLIRNILNTIFVILLTKLDVINEWISRIKDSTKHHSMSPSYTTQSRIQPIPVSSLPLQNERVDNLPPSKGQKLSNQIFQPKTPKQQQKRFNNLKGKGC